MLRVYNTIQKQKQKQKQKYNNNKFNNDYSKNLYEYFVFIKKSFIEVYFYKVNNTKIIIKSILN